MEEDSHYCLKCGATLVGLDNYISHRKLQCDSKMYEETCENLPETKIEIALNDKITAEAKAGSFCSESESGDKKIVQRITGDVEADDFFSSLELQSSSKTSTNSANVNIQGKLSCGIVTRSKSLLPPHQEMPKIPEASSVRTRTGRTRALEKGKRKRKARKAPGMRKKKVSEAQSRRSMRMLISVKPEDAEGSKSPESDRSRGEDEWNLCNMMLARKDMDERQLDARKANGEPTASVRRYTPEIFSLSPILMADELSVDKDVEVNKFLEEEDYGDDDDQYLNMDDVDEYPYGPPRCHTGGKWKPGTLPGGTSPMLWPSQTWFVPDEKQHDDGPAEPSADLPGEKYKSPTPSTGGKWKSCNPPSTYTGGKWKPSEALQLPKKNIQDVPPSSYTGGKWHPGKAAHSEPPSTHTGGKWRPQISPGQQPKTWKADGSVSPDAPPSGHSRGKWVPSDSKQSFDNQTLDVIASCQSTSGKCLKTSGGLIQYYCSPCNRRLASKRMYKNHVLSELHLKRVLQENELDFDSRSIKLFRGLFSVMNSKHRGIGKREIRKPEFLKDADSCAPGRRPKEGASPKRRRFARRELIRCNICKAKLFSFQLGKHLVSYYHSRRSRLNDPEQQRLVLDNIHAIVRQAPYQCGICKFYFNSHSKFKKHWTSDEHRWMEEPHGRKFWCILCNFECDTSRSMELHLDSNSHREVIMAVNKSIPIIIRQKQILNCKLCDKEFRYNFALIRHNRISHGINECENPKVHPCEHCAFKPKTVKSLQRHIIRRHKGTGKVPYFCGACDLYFATAEDARNHRKSQSHRARSNASGAGTPARPCPHCPLLLADTESLKEHIRQEHPSLRPKCSKCGAVFSIPQEVAHHNRGKCSFRPRDSDAPAGRFRCILCSFSADLEADLLHHRALHDASAADGDLPRYLPCPVCGKSYRSLPLKVHLRTHTGERPYSCATCSKTFIRRSQLSTHFRIDHGEAEPADKSNEGNEGPAKKEEKVVDGPKCGDPKCKYVAKDSQDSDRHALVHVGRKLFLCLLCNYRAKTNTLLKRHSKIHSDERSHACPHCSFRGRLASHLKRHLRLHTGAKPYKCPHCPYQCNILENLRKHVLKTQIHPGKKLYECKMCNFSTNALKSFKQHLLEKHRDKFGTEVAITTYMAGIYNVEEDVQTGDNPVPVKRKPATATPAKTDQSRVLDTVVILSKKFEPIAPKPKVGEARGETPKSLGNSVQDKRKILEMELEKLKNRAKGKPEAPVRSYPGPAILKAEKERKCKRISASQDSRIRTARTEDRPGSLANLATASNPEEPPPTYILYEGGISFVDNEDHLDQQEFYLLENYND